MQIYSHQASRKRITTILFILSASFSLFCQYPRLSFAAKQQNKEEEDLLQLQSMARAYREQGLEQQKLGNLEVAMGFYQKAVTLDPAFAAAYNDIGVIYETRGSTDEAEQSYLRAIKVDPYLLSAYSNLAALYENKRDLDMALYYWKKRAELGASDDPWREKARQRIRDILAVTGGSKMGEKEEDVIAILKEMGLDRQKEIQGTNELASSYFNRAKQAYRKGKEVDALKMAVDASLLDPTNTEITDFIEKTQIRLLTR